MEKVTLTWSFENWVTVVLMVAVGFAAVKLAVSLYQRNTGG